MFSIKILWLILVGVALVTAVASAPSIAFPGVMVIFLLSSSAVGLSLWIIWARYAKVSGRFLFLRVFGVMGVGAVLILAMTGFQIIASSPHYPEKINEADLKDSLFLASIVGVSLGVIFSVYRQRFGDSM